MEYKKSKLKGFEIGKRVETTEQYCESQCRRGFKAPYQSGKIKEILNDAKVLFPGALIRFISEQNGSPQLMHEKNLQKYTGVRCINGDQITSTTIDDILKNKNE